MERGDEGTGGRGAWGTGGRGDWEFSILNSQLLIPFLTRAELLTMSRVE